MSRRTAEANKAIRLAWQRECALVQEGKGTRDWTKKQQMDILNPEIGKAYDEEGKAFEGHHMKSAEAYPQYQGDLENIQFLSRAEHTQAHGGWQKPTNGYYDYITGSVNNFGEDELVPCKIIELSNPVIEIAICSVEIEAEHFEQVEKEQEVTVVPTTTICTPYVSNQNSAQTNTPNIPISKNKGENTLKRFGEKADKIIRKVGILALDNKEKILGIVATVAAICRVATSLDRTFSDGSDCSSSREVNNLLPSTSINNDCADTLGRTAERASPREHEVSGHSQHYHTKNGVEVREKTPYPRGYKKEEE